MNMQPQRSLCIVKWSVTCLQVLLMLPPKKRAELNNLKQQLSEVRKLTSDIHGVGRAVGGGLLQGTAYHRYIYVTWPPGTVTAVRALGC